MMGRPKLPKSEKLARRVTVFITEHEYRELKKICRERGMLPGHLLRKFLQEAAG